MVYFIDDLQSITGAKTMKVRLKDIAARTGLSIAAVSRALSDKSDISPETKDMVRRIAGEMGYIPNINARNMKSGRSGTVGMLTSHLVNALTAERTSYLIRKLQMRNIKLLISEFADNSIEWLLQNRVDAIIAGSMFIPEMVQQLKDISKRCLGNDFPIITFGTVHIPGTDAVKLDYIESGYKLAFHLYDSGCRSLLVTCGGVMSRREDGIRQAALERGLPMPELILDKEPTLASEYHAVKEYLANVKTLPDGIIIHNNHSAMGVLTALREHGIRIPQDMRAAILEDAGIGQYFTPPLTTCGFDHFLLTDQLWKILEYRLDHPGARGADIIKSIPPVLKIRESSASDGK